MYSYSDTIDVGPNSISNMTCAQNCIAYPFQYVIMVAKRPNQKYRNDGRYCVGSRRVGKHDVNTI